MLNLRENIKGVHLNQHQIEINMSREKQNQEIKYTYTVYTQRLMDYCVLNTLKLLSRMVQINKQ